MCTVTAITIPPMDQTVNIGDNATFTCEASVNMTVDFRWLFNGVEVMADPGHISVTSNVNTTTLMITNVTINDRGNYSCEVIDSNSGTTIVTSTEATLFSKCIGNFKKCEYLLTFKIYDTG